MDHYTRIAGIPAIVRVTHYFAGYTCPRHGHPDGWTEDEPPEIEWDVLDRRGYPAPWLERKLTPEIIEAIDRELLDMAENPEYDD